MLASVRLLRSAGLACVVIYSSAPADARAAISVGLEGAAVLGTFELRDRLEDGALVGLRIIGPTASAADWSLHLWLERHTPAGFDDLIPPGYYVPEYSPEQVYTGALLAGLGRSVDWGAVRPFVEGMAGLMVVREPGVPYRFFNARRDSVTDGSTLHFGPGFGFATGVQLRADDDLMIELSTGVLWQPVKGATGPTVPFRVGIAWPAPGADLERRSAPSRFSLLWSGGATRTNGVKFPDGTSGWMWGVAGEYRFSPILSFELQGEQSRHHSEMAIEFADSLSATTFTIDQQESYTTLLAGVRAGVSIGPVRPYASLAAGWGRYVTLATSDLGGSSATLMEDEQDAFANSVGLGIELPVGQRLTGFGEADAKWIHLHGTEDFVRLSTVDIQTVRAGLALRY